jgi:hypothetical protein
VPKLFIGLVTKWQWKSLKKNACVWNFAANLVKILQRHFNCLTKHMLGTLSSRSAPSVLVGTLFKKFGLFLNTVVRQYNLSQWYMVTNDPALGFQYRVVPAHFLTFHRNVLPAKKSWTLTPSLSFQPWSLRQHIFTKRYKNNLLPHDAKNPKYNHHLVTLNDTVPLMLQHPSSDTVKVLL